jgi:hypothetical protein
LPIAKQSVREENEAKASPERICVEKGRQFQELLELPSFCFIGTSTEGQRSYLFLCLIFFFNFLYLCFLIFLRRFLTTLLIER